jgi:hypothetical protein
MLLAVGLAVPGVDSDDFNNCNCGDVTAAFLPMSVAVLVPLGLGLVRAAGFSSLAMNLLGLLWVWCLNWKKPSSLSSGYDRSLPTMDKGVKAWSDIDRKAEGEVVAAETDEGDAVDAQSVVVSSSACVAAL